jgi:uncharacterized membrane protein YfcA
METGMYALVALIAALAGFTQGFAGFGSTLVALPLMGLFLELRVAVPVGCLMALTLNAALAARLRGHANRGALALLLGASLPGLALGALVLSGAPEPALKGLLGLVILYVCVGAGRSRSGAGAPGRGWVLATGLTAGALGVSIGVNGPPIVAWAARQNWTREIFKATLTTYFLLAGVCIVGTQGVQGRLDAQVLTLGAACLPGVLLGLWAGDVCSGKIQDRTFRRSVYGLLTAIALSLLCQAGVALG